MPVCETRTSEDVILNAGIRAVPAHGVRRSIRAQPSAAEGVALQYNRDVRPILAENCFPCHGPDSAARKADLRLDKREAAIEAGAIAPGDIEASELIARINADRSQGSDAPGRDHQDVEPETERRAQAVDCLGRSLSIALVSHSPCACRTTEAQESIVGP